MSSNSSQVNGKPNKNNNNNNNININNNNVNKINDNNNINNNISNYNNNSINSSSAITPQNVSNVPVTHSDSKQSDTDNVELHHTSKVKHAEPKPPPKGRFGWVKRLMQGQGQGHSANNHIGPNGVSQKHMNGRRIRNDVATTSTSAPATTNTTAMFPDENIGSYNRYYGNYGSSSRKNSSSNSEPRGENWKGKSNNRHSRSHSTGKHSVGTSLTIAQNSSTSVLGIASNDSSHERFDRRNSAGTSEISFNDVDRRSLTSGLSSFESNDIESDNVSTIPLKSITLGTSTATREPSILSNNHRSGLPNGHYIHYSHQSTAATIVTAATSTSTAASMTQGLGIDLFSGHEPSTTAPSIMTNTLIVPSVHSPMDTESIITLASSSRRMRRRSIDTNCSTNGIPPASIFERLSVYPRENMRDSDVVTTNTTNTTTGGGNRITSTSTNTTTCSTLSSNAVGNPNNGTSVSHASNSKPGSLYASSVVTSNNEGGNSGESPVTTSINETSVGA
ncbi:uncharacterized protein KQ657_000469 [Scheffersomyces spartinae]|uniref:Uncharacterized protein n=1 Tax=Scheffersomyces spartinae TaxID=45513 RepID=A0A9P7V9D3_9ASCO|nr:uncharacterized protein KQ657_000469 [Scheffersomyces spartinae]KAG7193777.1 hypothetical protein KQ657_000469 [Scheffersomyces spartinae]